MVKMFDTCFDDTLRHLSFVEKLPHLHRDPRRSKTLRLYQSELRFYRMFLWCVPDCDADLLAEFNFISTSIAQLYEYSQGTDSFALTYAEYTSLATEIIDKFIVCQAEINEYDREDLIFSSSLNDEPFTSKETMEFLDSIHVTVNDLLNMFPTENSLKSLVDIVLLLRDLVYYTPFGGENNDQGFNVHEWANTTACMLLLYWLAGTEDKIFISLLIDFQIIDPCYPNFIKSCFQNVKVPKMKPVDRILFGEFVYRFVDFFLENLLLILNDDVHMVREGLIFIITFLADPPENTMNDSELLPLVQERIYAVLDQASDNMCFYSETNMDLARGKTMLDDFLKSIDEVTEDIVNLYVHIPPSSWTDFPRIDRFGYFEGLLAYLQNLKETMNNNKKLVPFLKHQIFTIHEELFPLRSFLQDTMAMQNEHNGLKNIVEQIISLSYQVDFAIKLSFFTDNAVWHNLACLSFFIRKIKDIRYKVIEFETQTEGSHICRTESILPLMCSIDVPNPATSTSIVEVLVGFKQEIEGLIDRLTWGSAKLDIISIVGMGGIGKTALAKKLYNEPSIKLHFHKRAFCSVSQVYKKRKLLLDILRDISLIDDEIRQMSVEDLPLKLYQRLKGFKYLIVLDDIWDINVWDDLRHSLPDDHNGSRVVFTTRISSISLTAKPDSIPCRVPFLSDDESWELLQQRIFHNDPCPPNLLNVGKLIAKDCKGLPLSIVVIAGLLARRETQWNEVAETLTSYASNEGCRDIIKLSYMHLPEVLKSCFLYLGAFSEGYKFDARTLALLWVAEGFVLKSGDKCLHRIAKRYLNDLSDRNLVTVTERSHNGGIKRYHVHDLIRDFCRSEAEEEHYMCYINAHNKNFLMSSVLYHYRICIEVDWRSFVDEKPRGSMVHSLLYFPDYLLPFSKAYTEVKSLQYVLSNFKLVEVLDLREVEISGEFPITVTTLVHLRHLGLRFSGSVYVPPDIRNLWNLETLVLWGYDYSNRHVSPILDWVDNRMITKLYEVIQNNNNINPYVVSFPADIWKMIRLTHVEAVHMAYVATTDDATTVFSPLPDLKSFTTLHIPQQKEGEELLRRLSNVRKFSCMCHGWWDQDRECSQLPKLEILTKLETLSMALSRNSHPPFIYSFPTTIRKLTLKSDNLPWNDLSVIIGMLPCLEVLVLHTILVGGKRWDVEDDEFPSIKSLTLKGLDIEEWNASIDSFPSLEILIVSLCHSLVEIPSCFSDTATLKCIKVSSCEKSVADSAIQIQKDQVDSGNESFELVLFNIET